MSEVAAPAAAGLLDRAAYTTAVLSPPGGQLTVPALDPHFWSVGGLVTTAGAMALGVLLARAVVRGQQPRPITTLRALHNGSVNDYAAYAVGGLLWVISLLGLG